MSDPFHVPESLLAWVNGRLQKKEQPFELKSVEFGDDGRVRVEATVQKYMMSADVEVQGRLEASGKKLVVKDLDVSTRNPMLQGMLKQLLPALIAKARESLRKHDVEIVARGAAAPDGAADETPTDEAPPGPDAQASA